MSEAENIFVGPGLEALVTVFIHALFGALHFLALSGSDLFLSLAPLPMTLLTSISNV